MLMVNGYDNYQVINHYGEVSEQQFVKGELHRPWIHYTLEGELNLLVSFGAVQRTTKDGRTMISLTDQGCEHYNVIQKFLQETGFLRKRSALMRLSQFGQFEDYDQVVNELGNMQELRDKVLRESDIQSGMHVLELGCGTGAMTIDSGLYRRVGSYGQVTATDPSLGMLARANKKLEKLSVSNVKFVQAPAERLPFKDNSFDAVVGCSFLHFTNIPATLREIHRVAKPGAKFTTIYALKFPYANEFLSEWFEPLLVSLKHQDEQPDIFPNPDTVVNAMEDGQYEDIEIYGIDGVFDYRNPESAAKFLVQVVNIFERTMNELPWQARQDMIQLLIERGHHIQQKYSPEQLVQIHPGQFLKAKIRKLQ